MDEANEQPDAAAEWVAAFEAWGWFAPRAEAEEQPAWKQLIPYCSVRRGDDLLCIRRLKAQSEGRLHGLRSIGFGGHVNPPDGTGPGLLAAAMRRELDEELVLPAGPLRPRILGLLNDDRTPVGRVHTGLVHELEVPAGAAVVVRETDKMEGRFEPLEALRRLAGLPTGTGRVVESSTLWQDSDAFESWSAIMLEAGYREPRCRSRGGTRAARREDSHDG